jgi:hypothetical protein
MTSFNLTDSLRSSNIRGMLAVARRFIGGPRGLLLLAGLAIAGGLAFKWSWLVAAGIAPVIVGLLPCAAMCALGLCMPKMLGSSSTPKPPAANKEAESSPDRQN